VTWTDEATAAFEGFMEGYISLLSSSMAGNAALAELGDFAEIMPTMMSQYAGMMKCMRGDIAQVFDMSDGIRFTQVVGIRNSDDCNDFNQRVLDMAAGLPEAFSDLVSFSADGLTHRGVTALEYGFDPSKFVNLPDEEGTAEGMAIITGILGEDGFKSYMAQADGHWVATGGVGADASFKTLIDRIKDKKSGGGIDEAVFSPFTVGAGFYMMLDFGRLLGGIGKFLPEEAADSGELAEVQELFNALGAMTAGLELQRDALGVKFAMSTAGLSTIAEMAQREAAEEADDDDEHDGEDSEK
jgi:hypothetical protein